MSFLLFFLSLSQNLWTCKIKNFKLSFIKSLHFLSNHLTNSYKNTTLHSLFMKDILLINLPDILNIKTPLLKIFVNIIHPNTIIYSIKMWYCYLYRIKTLQHSDTKNSTYCSFSIANNLPKHHIFHQTFSPNFKNIPSAM